MYLFDESWLEYSWKKLFIDCLPSELHLALRNPIPIQPGDQNQLLISLRSMLSNTQMSKQLTLFLLHMLQELSAVSSIHMKLYLALS